ncbi:7-carboxy-7-deazaguanine synthase [Ferrovum myxofaciens]|jgi:7-carboxy-7-deazaguanine synthase (Cx14CxxC type)|uniref:7-carboxy-7-deazaguanine synthase n=1 Tax=Ferrovum myxofaciens TaxID=416213 RepID=A0A859A906_9PROT|nr:7-carboxy-7-deazaguanine synthase [Ferrovum myxofaciens]MBW8028875.1 7-carboxy-7-deazaguanine synthase [Ferrovum sp.]KXW57654.1 7-carboxy-7-deazaguanine synthase [Ferrovum myxofaciens]MBU6994681.1 7-carboxy-7-deazaguanine synthase [Ferrovum myxofaciens]QKE38532.1 MAG: 7-carboxy-7-deazaguanine synthase [Ferrovum myxofaciens]QWY73724.1 MAG: 7-carboxy-7-deazaguanine synthase [Ferrovum myxofaciens]
MTYSVKEIFLTLQGEGCHTGRAAVFCRFSGCNLWSGRAEDRAQARCRFCDTDFLGTEGAGGGKFDSAPALAHAIERCWQDGMAGEDSMRRWVVLTGGEPLLQVDEDLVGALHERGFGVAVETNGTIPPPPGIDWICVSPKGKEPLQVHRGDELKLVYPQADCPPERFVTLNFHHFLLQPLDEGGDRRHEPATVSYCRSHPRWQLSLQIHKWLGIP